MDMSARKFSLSKISFVFAALLLSSPVFGQTYNDYVHQQTASGAVQPTSPSLATLPSYPYDPHYDPEQIPTAPGVIASDRARHDVLATHSGADLGFQISDYRYREPGLDVNIYGPKYGLNLLLTGKVTDNAFIAADLRGALGWSNYTGSGRHNDNFEDLGDIRLLGGYDFFLDRFSLSPFTGIGYRDLYSDDRGRTDTGFYGYRRENQLLYLPLGIEPRFRVTPESRVAVDMEYDYVITGWQSSKLSDVTPLLPDLTNTQRSGNGFRGSVMWEMPTWSAGPFFNYWNIDQSDSTCATTLYVLACGHEPSNHTFEFGGQFRLHFL
jgi:hypothetical protein